MSVKAAEYPIEKVFSDEFTFKIPGYQRPYAWTVEQAEELLDDLMTALGDTEEPIDKADPYFLGSIVWVYRVNYAELKSRCQQIRHRNSKLAKFLNP